MPRRAKSSSRPVVPCGFPATMVWKVRVGMNQSCSDSPPTPSGFFSLWRGPAP